VSPKTRRRVFLSVLMVALMLPAEVVLLKALQAPNDKVAADQWVAELDGAALEDAAKAIQSYSVPYRRAIMGALSPAERASVWRDHIDQYVASHRDLNTVAIDALRSAQAALTPTALGEKATSTERAALDAAGKQIEAVLGVEEAGYVARDLGARGATMANAEPLLDRLASVARNQFILLARADDCNCAGDQECGYYSAYCSTSAGCQTDGSWPMCGYWWNTPCNGLCTEQ
jgi:hypothetical protein